MPSSRKFYKHVVTVTVLTDEAGYDPQTLSEIAHDITDGDCQGDWGSEVFEIDGPAAAKLMKEQGSEPEFFQLDDEGNDTNISDAI